MRGAILLYFYRPDTPACSEQGQREVNCCFVSCVDCILSSFSLNFMPKAWRDERCRTLQMIYDFCHKVFFARTPRFETVVGWGVANCI